MQRKLLILLFLGLQVLFLPAQNPSAGDSLSARFLRINYPDQSKSLSLVTTDTIFTFRNLTFYNYAHPKGFVILRNLGEKYDIVGYSFDQHFSFDVDTTGFLLNLANSMADVAGSPGYAPTDIHSSLKTGRYAIEPLIRTTWNQGWPYNIFCPADPIVPSDDNRTVVGCVAVAMGQIIRYYDKWSVYSISNSYEHPVYGTLSCNAGHYNWSQMENSCFSINNEVAMFLYDCGVLVNMDYSQTGSGANSGIAAGRLKEIYHNGYLNETIESEAEFYNNISKYQPIYATYPGHAFVCDGYDGSGFYHFNLGWGGSSNGYYALGNVLGKALTSAIFNTYPDLPVKPPGRLQKSEISAGKLPISWTGPDQERSTLTGYKIYLDDQYLTETPDTVFIHDCIAGEHYLKVSAQFQTGESRWIGPVSYYFDGNPVDIPDATLKRALNTSIGIPSSQVGSHAPTEGELSRIIWLNVSNALSLSGLEYVRNLKQFYLYSSTTTKMLDMEQIQSCAGLATLTIINYRLANPQALGNLTRLTGLKLTNNHLESTDFLKLLTLITNLEITDNAIPEVSFLNSMERVEHLILKSCSITGFSVLNNTYGLRSVDISNNQVESLDWLKQCNTLQSLNAASNNIAGSIELSGLTQLTTIDLSGNSITGLNLGGSPNLESLILPDNKITDITQLLADKPKLVTLTAHHNLITALPDVSTSLTRLELQNNLIKEVRRVSRYYYVTYLNLSNNQITDLTGITNNDFHTRLTWLNLLNNPISKESFLEIAPVIKASGISATLPVQFHPGSPCYLDPGKDTSMVNKLIHFTWQADFNQEGYVYTVLLSKEGGPNDTIATGLLYTMLDYSVSGAGKYSWQVISGKDSLTLYSRVESFLVVNGFSIPYNEDFEIYNANSPLCAQSPFWKIYGPVQDPFKDASVTGTRAFEGAQSIKISGISDIWFPVSEYLTGSCNIEFNMMVDKTRKAFFQAIFNSGSTVSLYFYSDGVVMVYNSNVFYKYLTFKPREWITIAIDFTAPSDYKVYLDSQVASEGKAGNAASPGVSGIRFGTSDGPGSYQNLPVVYYVDNFAITGGTPLSVQNSEASDPFPAVIIPNGESMVLRGISPSIRTVRIFSTDGRLLFTQLFRDQDNSKPEISVLVKEKVFLIVLYDSSGRAWCKKMVRSF